jgi:asparagine synthetase B (glutamine-hydrolysing)
MCGISGFIHHSSTYLSGALDVVKDMTYFNRLRGVDALGFIKVQYNGDYEVHKGVGDPIQLMGAKDLRTFSPTSLIEGT